MNQTYPDTLYRPSDGDQFDHLGDGKYEFTGKWGTDQYDYEVLISCGFLDRPPTKEQMRRANLSENDRRLEDIEQSIQKLHDRLSRLEIESTGFPGKL